MIEHVSTKISLPLATQRSLDCKVALERIPSIGCMCVHRASMHQIRHSANNSAIGLVYCCTPYRKTRLGRADPDELKCAITNADQVTL